MYTTVSFGDPIVLLLIVATVIVTAILFVSALVDIARASRAGSDVTLWFVAVLIFPFIGSLLWFAVGKNRAA